MDNDGLVLAAEYMPVFPIIGALIGLIAGTVGWILQAVLPRLLASMLTLGVLLLLNGAQHVDGLLDFGDGIMCHGSRNRKLRVMRDPNTGAGGFTLGWIILSATAISIASLSRGVLIQSLTTSEAAATLSMVFEARTGSAAHKGMSSGFIAAMHGRWSNLRLALSVLLLVLIAIPLLHTVGVAVIGVAVIVPVIMTNVSDRAFGGVTGDVMGATHELTRFLSLTVVLVGMQWL
jgi:adenosylcobinamide-GDP ribazoletransferase